MIITLVRIIKMAWNNFSRNIWLSLATVSIFILSLSVIYGLFVFDYTADYLVETIRDKVDISVYFKPDANESDILKIKGDLATRDDIKAVEYISREDALNKFKERHKDNNLLMESISELDSNPLRATLNVKAYQASQYEALATLFGGSRYQNLIEKVNYKENQSVIDKIFEISKTVKTFGLILSLILAIIASLVTFNTIRLAIYSQRDEISIMRLVGAGKWFVRGPFLVEAAFSGIFAAIITLVIFFALIPFLSPRISLILPGMNLAQYSMAHFFGNFFMLSALGVGLGIISSFLATRRYLNV